MDIVYHEPNDTTIAAIDEARSTKQLERLDLKRFDELMEALWYVGLEIDDAVQEGFETLQTQEKGVGRTTSYFG